jgi:hypothetical protein
VDEKKVDEYVLFLKFAYSDEIEVKAVDASALTTKHFKRYAYFPLMTCEELLLL